MLVVDDAGRDGVDVDMVLDEVEARALGEADDRRLRRAVDGDERLAATSGLGGQVDDLAAAALLDHLLGAGLQHEQKALDIDGIDAPVALAGDLDNRREVEDAGVVDQDVEAAEMRYGGGDRRVDRSLFGDVELDPEGVRPEGGGDGLGARFVQVGDDDLRAFLHVALRDGLADAARGAGDDCNFVPDLHDSLLGPLWTASVHATASAAG